MRLATPISYAFCGEPHNGGRARGALTLVAFSALFGVFRGPARALCATALVWLLLCMPAPAQQTGTMEKNVKAAFVYHFTQFVDWPSSAFQAPDDPFRICVLADDYFVRAIDEIIKDETARGRPLQRLPPEPDQVRRCHILYIGGTDAGRTGRLLGQVAGAPVLTVGESPRFLDEGGTIGFVLEHNKVRFDLNLAAAQRAGLAISSKLIRVARNVREGT
jgi:hypothetical protein